MPATEVAATAKREPKAEKMVSKKDWMRARMELMSEAREEVMLLIFFYVVLLGAGCCAVKVIGWLCEVLGFALKWRWSLVGVRRGGGVAMLCLVVNVKCKKYLGDDNPK